MKNLGEMIRMAHRDPSETFALIDMDGDGESEKISVEGEENRNREFYLSGDYLLKMENFTEERYGSNLYNEIWAFSPDGDHIYIVLEDDGPSADPATTFFRYEEGKLLEAGSIYSWADSMEWENGICKAVIRCDVIQTDAVTRKYRFNEEGSLEEIVPDIYDFSGSNDIKLLKELKLHTSPDSQETFVLQPQTVWFVQVDPTFTWIRLEAEDGQNGWFYMSDYSTVYEDIDVGELFEGLMYAG